MTPSEPAPSNVVAFPNGEVLRLQLVASTLLGALREIGNLASDGRRSANLPIIARKAYDAIALAEKGGAR